MQFDAKAAFQSTNSKLCSTARILLYLFKLYYAASSLDDNNPIVRQAAMLYIREAHIDNELENLMSELPQIRAVITNLLNQLNEHGSPQTKQTYNSKKGEIDHYFTKIDNHTTKTDALRTGNKNAQTKVLDSIGGLMIKVAESKVPEAMAGDATIQSVLNTAQKSQEERRKELTRIARETIQLEDQGNAYGIELHAKSPAMIQDSSKLTEPMRRQGQVSTPSGRIGSG